MAALGSVFLAADACAAGLEIISDCLVSGNDERAGTDVRILQLMNCRDSEDSASND